MKPPGLTKTGFSHTAFRCVANGLPKNVGGAGQSADELRARHGGRWTTKPGVQSPEAQLCLMRQAEVVHRENFYGRTS
jgi:hypothetical protein